VGSLVDFMVVGEGDGGLEGALDLIENVSA